MSDVPVLNRRDQGISSEDIQHIEAVSESLGAFNKHVSFIGEKLNDIKKPTASRRDSGEQKESMSISQKGEEALRHDKVRPRRNSLKQYGGAIGATGIFLADVLRKVSQGEDAGGGSGLKQGLGMAAGGSIGRMAKNIFPKLMKAAPWLALAGGIIWGVIDAIAAIAKSGEWDVSKVSAAIGGFIGGAGEGGLMNAFKNAGKWALIGAGVGSIVPGIGTIAGGLVGAAFGAIMGFIGGENIAQAIERAKDAIMSIPLVDRLVGYISDLWSNLAGIVTDTLSNISDIWSDDENSFGEKLGKTVAALLTGWWSILGNMVSTTWTMLKDMFLSFFVGQKDEEGKRTKKSIVKKLTDFMVDMGGALLTAVSDFFGGLFEGIDNMTGGGISDALDKMGDAWQWTKDNVIDPIKGFFADLGTKIGNMWESVKDFTSTYIVTPVSDFFSVLGVEIGNMWESVKDFTSTYIVTPVSDFFSNLGGAIQDAWKSVNEWVKDSIVGPIRDLFSSIQLYFERFHALIPGSGAAFREVKGGQETLRGVGASSSSMMMEYARSIMESMSGVDSIGQAFKTINQMERDTIRDSFGKFREARQVDDAIITPQGDIVKTNPDDFLYAAKNLSAVTESESSAAIEDIQRSQLMLQQKTIDRMDQLIAAMQQGGETAAPGNVVQQNITSRYSPMNIMNTLTATGEV